MPTPVYLFCGFLESGKTTMVQESLEDKGFFDGERTLLLQCEEGETAYDPRHFGGEVCTHALDAESDLTLETLLTLQKQHKAERVIIEYNGMWKLKTLHDALPDSWKIYQIITVADSATFPAYLQNMRQQAVDKLQDAEAVIFNRCTAATDKTLLHRAVRMVNRRAAILFERTDGSVDEDDIVDPLPFDITADDVYIADTDFALWYMDAFEHVENYRGKTVHLKAYVCQTDSVPRGCFVLGRFAMTCCEDDITFLGMICENDNAQDFPHRSWIDISAVVTVKQHAIYNGKGPWLKAVSVTPAAPPSEELVYFMR